MRRVKFKIQRLPPGEDSHANEIADQPLPLGEGIPIGIFEGYVGPGSHAIIEALPGGSHAQINPAPVTFARYNMGRGIHDVQLNNGWQGTNYGKRLDYRMASYLNNVRPTIPGQSRVYGSGGPPAPFVPRGAAPSQWQQLVDAAQAAPRTPGGPGQHMGTVTYPGQSGG